LATAAVTAMAKAVERTTTTVEMALAAVPP
jgi:hypothetical protein